MRMQRFGGEQTIGNILFALALVVAAAAAAAKTSGRRRGQFASSKWKLLPDESHYIQLEHATRCKGSNTCLRWGA